jgi:hypothetical protein
VLQDEARRTASHNGSSLGWSKLQIRAVIGLLRSALLALSALGPVLLAHNRSRRGCTPSPSCCRPASPGRCTVSLDLVIRPLLAQVTHRFPPTSSGCLWLIGAPPSSVSAPSRAFQELHPNTDLVLMRVPGLGLRQLSPVVELDRSHPDGPSGSPKNSGQKPKARLPAPTVTPRMDPSRFGKKSANTAIPARCLRL